MSSLLDFDGMYDPKRSFAVTNWSEEDFTVNWRDDLGDNFYTLHAGETKTYPMYLAYFITKNYVDREMYRDANKEAVDTKQRERLEMNVANREMRKPYEDKTMQEVLAGQESPEVTAMRAKIRQELIVEQGMSSEMHNKPDGTAPEEFPDVKAKKPAKSKAADAAAGV